jgi:putative ABC transport system permease protein
MATLDKTFPQTAVLPGRVRAPKSALQLGEALFLAFDTLRKNPLRSSLTILGIVIGITTVITVSALINGLNDNVLAGIRELGSDTIICYRFPWASLSRPPSEWLNRKELQPEWAEEIEKLPHVGAASPSMRIFMPQFGAGTADVRRGSFRAKNVILQGNSPSINRIFDMKIQYGRPFDENDTEHRTPVVMLGYDTTRTLFPGSPSDAIGK